VRQVWTGAVVAALLVAAGCGGGSSHSDARTFCARLERLTQNDPFRAFGARATSTEIKAAFDALHTSAARLAAVAPDEARSAATDFADAADRMRSLMAGAGYDGSLVDAPRYRDAQVDYFAASGRLERYLVASCRSTTTTTTTLKR
jgi:hypothetical protein